jgi:hypothetical protein
MIRWSHILLLLVGGVDFALLAGCETTPKTSAAAAPAYVSLERVTAGQVVGPAYVVTLYEDGGVLFEGHASVKSKGTFTKRIPPAEAARIFAELEAANIWEREPRYDVERGGQAGDSRILRVAPTEAAWDNLIARRRGRFKRIDGLFFAPSVLLDLKTHIEKAVGLAEWIGQPGEWKN